MKKCNTFEVAWNFINRRKRRTPIKYFRVYSPLFGCPIVRLWRKTLKKLLKKDFRIVCRNDKLFLGWYQQKGKSLNIHQRNLPVLATEIYNMRNNLRIKLWHILFAAHRSHTVQEMIQLCKAKELYSVFRIRKYIFSCLKMRK